MVELVGLEPTARVLWNVGVARPAELLPFSDEVSVRIEDLDAAVAAVGDVDLAVAVDADAVHLAVRCELSRAAAHGAPLADLLAVLVEVEDVVLDEDVVSVEELLGRVEDDVGEDIVKSLLR